MHPAFPYRIKDQQLWLSSERSIFWEEEKALIVSDLHFGKTGHFRKSGVAVPQTVYKEDLQRLLAQLQYFQPRKLIIVGDLFHSHANKELELFRKWRENFPDLLIQLIKGNHDILHDDWYAQAGIEVSNEKLSVNNFHFIHDITDMFGYRASAVSYSFSGHIHPGIRINGMGKQSLCFPCFYFGKTYAVLPAFSRFTGLALIEPEMNGHVFVITAANPGRGEHSSIIQIQ